MAELTAFRVGHCTHPSCMVLKGSGFASLCFPSRAYLVETRAGLCLWDTGYAERFRDATSRGLYRLYPLVTPVHLDAAESLVGQLGAQGVRPADIHTVVVSHFHADHMAGLRDFPAARLVASAAAWQSVQGLSAFASVRQAFVPDLMPPDIATRLQFVETIAPTALPASLTPFATGRDLMGTGELFVVDLPGHAAGHLGAFVQGDRPTRAASGWTLLASDAAWVNDSYEGAQVRGPSELSFLIQHSRCDYYATLRKLQALHAAGGADIHLTHEDVARDGHLAAPAPNGSRP